MGSMDPLGLQALGPKPSTLGVAGFGGLNLKPLGLQALRPYTLNPLGFQALRP